MRERIGATRGSAAVASPPYAPSACGGKPESHLRINERCHVDERGPALAHLGDAPASEAHAS